MIAAMFLLGVGGCGDQPDTPFDRPVDVPIFDPGPPPVLPNDPNAGGNVPTGNTGGTQPDPSNPQNPPNTGGSNPPTPPPEPVIMGVRCSPDANGEFRKDLSLDRGHSSFDWGHGEGCIGRSLREVWAVLHNQSLLVWEGVDKVDAQVNHELPANAVFGYRVKYFVDDIIDVDWTMDWYHSLISGTLQKPIRLIVNYKKISGTRYISYWEGSLVLDYVAPRITSFKMRDQINASRTNADDAAGSVKDVYQKLSEGAPVWGPLGGS